LSFVSEVRALAERQERADRERTELKERIESARRLELGATAHGRRED